MCEHTRVATFQLDDFDPNENGCHDDRHLGQEEDEISNGVDGGNPEKKSEGILVLKIVLQPRYYRD